MVISRNFLVYSKNPMDFYFLLSKSERSSATFQLRVSHSPIPYSKHHPEEEYIQDTSHRYRRKRTHTPCSVRIKPFQQVLPSFLFTMNLKQGVRHFPFSQKKWKIFVL